MKRIRLRAALYASAVCSLLTFTAVQSNEVGDLDGNAMMITNGDPQNPKYANAGPNLRNGVGSIFVEFAGIEGSGFLCTASAIGDRHILTAAHCLRETGDTVSRIRFILSAGLATPIIIEGASFAVHPWFDFFLPFYGAFAHGDVAVIELAENLPAGIEHYELYRDADEFDQTTRHYGHGMSGRGNRGATGDSSFFFARTGLNRYEQTLEPFLGDGVADQLLYDFDSGGRKHNAMEWWFTSMWACHPENADNPSRAQDGQCTTYKDGSYPDFKGFRKLEVGIAPGDSGGPGFIDGKIAGIHSFGFTHGCEGVTNGTDFNCSLDSSYGEMAGDTSVAYHQRFIDDVVAGAFPSSLVPEAVPSAVAAATYDAVEISVGGKAFAKKVLARRMRKSVTLDID